MLVRLNRDNNLAGGIEMDAWVEREVSAAMLRFGTQVTRVEVFLSDENSHKEGGLDKKCTLEARLAGLEPIAVSQQAGDYRSALDAALETLQVTLDRKLQRLRTPKGRTSFGGEKGD
jgi:hypothetical protein